jgi:drug/metabolite transporter (DMT)-like permease
LAGAVFSAGAYVMVRRLRREEPLVILFYFALVSALGSLPVVLPVFVPPRGMEWGVLLAVGATTHLGQLCLTRGLRTERAGRATAVGVLQIVFAAFWGLAFFGERPDGWTVLGAVLIVLSTLAIARVSARGPVAVEVALPAPPPESAGPLRP